MKNKAFLLKLLVSVLLMVLLIRYLKPEEAYSVLRNIRIHYLAAVIVVINLDRIFMAFKWWILLEAKGLDAPLSSLIKGYYVSTFLAPVLPTAIGDVVVRGVSVTHAGIGSENVFSSIVMERILGMLSLLFLVFVSLGLFVLGNRPPFGSTLVYIGMFLLLSLAAFSFSLKKRVSFERAGDRASESAGKVSAYFEKIYASYFEYKNHHKTLVLFFILSVFEHLIMVYANYLIIRGLGFDVSFLSMFYTIPAILFLSRLPISIGQIGTQEGAYVLLLSLVGLTVTDSVTVSLVRRVVVFLSVLPVFLYLLASKHERTNGPLAYIRQNLPGMNR